MPAVFQLQEHLQEWRRNANRNGIPFFVFTMVRKALDEYLSVYNYFCIFLGKLKHVTCPEPWTVDGMLSTSPDNPQTRWLIHGTTLFLGGKAGVDTTQIPVTTSSSQLLKIMEFHLNWVGTLERFNETLSVFRSMGIQFVNSRKNQAIGFKKITKNEINKTTLSFIEGKLLEYKRLYSWARKRYGVVT